MTRFFAPPDLYSAAGLFGKAHLALFSLAVLLIALSLWASREMSPLGVRRVIRVATLSLWLLEGVKIAFVLLVARTRNPNEYVPLYYCSITLYAGALSSLCKGTLRRVGDAFLATGCLVGGAVFLCVPLTSLSRYPAWHFISLHSFLLHALMVYLALLVLWRGDYRVRLRDILYHGALVSTVCAVALAFNLCYDARHGDAPVANLMFISKDFPGTPISFFYHLCGPLLYPAAAMLAQSLLPALAVYAVQSAILRRRAERMIL